MELHRFYKGVVPSVMPSKRSQPVTNLMWDLSLVTVRLVPERLFSSSTVWVCDHSWHPIPPGF